MSAKLYVTHIAALCAALVMAATLLLLPGLGVAQPVPPPADAEATYLEALHLFDRVDTENGKGMDVFKQKLEAAAGKGQREAKALWDVIDSASNGADLITKLKPLANAGNVVAETFVGSSYANGPNANFALAHQLLQSAANKPVGGADAQMELGKLYSAGQGMPANELVAMRWLRKSAANGNPLAQRTLAQLDGETARQKANDAVCERKVRAECDQMAPSAQPGCQLMMRKYFRC